MIADYISNAGLYMNISGRISKALKYLQSTDFSVSESGRHDIEGDDVFALIQKYETMPVADGKWEAHKNYIDIQYIVSGTEQIGYANVNDLSITEAYDETKDAMLLKGSGDMITCKKGVFMILFPEDAHMPGRSIDNPEEVKKVVVKVRV
jgi:YhcH/YjgK/YiaL family protein